MTNEIWDIPPLPPHGDPSEGVTYAAVGKAMTRWEGIEVEFAHLYSLLTGGDRFDLIKNREYGIPLNFRDRLKGLRGAASSYFLGEPDQRLEGEFCDMTKMAEKLSDRRNDIAHGIARPFQWILGQQASAEPGKLPPLQWCVVPPHFKAAKYDHERLPKYVLTSVEIDWFSEQFYAAQMRANTFTHQIEARLSSSPDKRP
jgi:hypothetical protein